ncbi:Lar family restriction alleviation protein [Acetobacter persici]|uniref:Lar family restriction alleviation protein n=1 Tax=Acetobacter persici TaxID=1076596 RepID=UPI001BA9EEAC|nr:Lar family restriction alleviation protein [Acetobacter persici]
MSEELKSCPFCGSNHVTSATTAKRSSIHRVGCMECFAFGPERKSTSEAITAWNTRAGEKV